MSALRGMDCHFGQGYYFAKPLTADALEVLLERQTEQPGWAFDGPQVADRAFV